VEVAKHCLRDGVLCFRHSAHTCKKGCIGVVPGMWQ
jgi:hypothetical protein